MRIRSTILALGLASAMAGCGAAQHRGPNVATADCAGANSGQAVAELYSPGRIHKIEPIYRTELLARATTRRYVVGANLYMPAEPGMTPAYLERAFSCHAVSGLGQHPNDPLRTRGVVDVDVAAVGPTIRVAITGADRTVGKAILQRARALQEQRGEVSVEQLSATPGLPKF